MSNPDLRTLAETIIDKGYVLSLGTIDEAGVWVADVIYVRDDDMNLYWISFPQARHSAAIKKNPNVACTITPIWETDKEEALQIAGVAELFNGDQTELERKMNAKRGQPEPNIPGEILKEGHVWYVLKPSKIEIIHNELFGYKKQVLEL